MPRKRRGKGNRRKKPRPSVTGWAAAGALAMPLIGFALRQDLSIQQKIDNFRLSYTGLDPSGQFRLDVLQKTYGPVALMLLGKKLASKAGLKMPNGVPFNL